MSSASGSIHSTQHIRNAAPTIALSAIGTSVWWAMRSIGAATFSPIGVGLGVVAYAIVKKFATPFFQEIFEAPRGASEDIISRNRFHCYHAINLASSTAALLTIYTIGALTLTAFSPIIMFETLLFLKGVEVLSNKMPDLIQRLEHTLQEKFPTWFEERAGAAHEGSH